MASHTGCLLERNGVISRDSCLMTEGQGVKRKRREGSGETERRGKDGGREQVRCRSAPVGVTTPWVDTPGPEELRFDTLASKQAGETGDPSEPHCFNNIISTTKNSWRQRDFLLMSKNLPKCVSMLQCFNEINKRKCKRFGRHTSYARRHPGTACRYVFLVLSSGASLATAT